MRQMPTHLLQAAHSSRISMIAAGAVSGSAAASSSARDCISDRHRRSGASPCQGLDCPSFARPTALPRKGKRTTVDPGHDRLGRRISASDVSPGSLQSRVTSNSYSENPIASPAGAHQFPRPCAALSSAIKRRIQAVAIREDLANSRLPSGSQSKAAKCRLFSCASAIFSNASTNRVRTVGASADASAQVTIPSANQIGSAFGKPFPFPLWLTIHQAFYQGVA